MSYGGGVNSTALGILLCSERLNQYKPWRAVWSDTHDERSETYAYIADIFEPYLAKHGIKLEKVRPLEGVIERWERLSVTGSRLLRTCTYHAKIQPLMAYVAQHGNPGDPYIIGIDAGEVHRAKPAQPGEREKIYPLVDLNIDREGCIEIIKRAGLSVPVKSGCWHCPFLRVHEILELGKNHPDLLDRIDRLEQAATAAHPIEPGKLRTQWHDRPADYWRQRSREDAKQLRLPFSGPEIPCGCFDGDDES